MAQLQIATWTLPSDLFKALPERDGHREAKQRALNLLQGFFERIAGRAYLSSLLRVYYRGKPTKLSRSSND